MNAGALIASWLESEGRRPSWLAKEAAISPAHLSLVMSGKKGLSPASAERIADLTDIDVRRLLGISVKSEAAA